MRTRIHDLAIDNGTVVTGTGRARRHVYVREGRISKVTDPREAADRRIDASGLLVMPGMVDTHVHLQDPGATEREDFPSGTAAAALAGVTTVVEHTHAAPVRDPAALAAKVAYLASRSRVDFGLAAHAWPDEKAAVGPLWRAGGTFLKVFTCTTHGIPGFDHGALLELFRAVAEVGAVCLVHSEDEAITRAAEDRLRAAGRDDPGVITEWRSRDAELAALSAVARLTNETGARVVLAHVSHAEAVDAVATWRSRGAAVTIETCPQYLTLFENEILEHGALRKFTPPARARNQAELDGMWHLLGNGTVDLISTDHAPSTRAQKQEGSIWDVHFGLPGLDTTFPLLLDAAARGLISYERVVAAYSEAPARTYGLHPRKGHLAPGADADLVLVDPSSRWTLSDALVRSKAGWTPYAGRAVVGRPVATILRGEVIAQKGEVLAPPGQGRWIPGPGASGASQ
jgi:dihydroorotase (multifunctional complex type)